jgi:hypothetical protein
MPTAHVMLAPHRSHREPTPRRSLRGCGSRMVPPAAIPLLVLGLMALGQHEARAEITYAIQDYPALQNGYTIEGSITTDGSIGTLSTTDFIKDWSISILKDGVTQTTYSGGSGTAGGAILSFGDLIVTSESIKLDFSVNTDFHLSSGSSLTEWQSVIDLPPAITVYNSSDSQMLFWVTSSTAFDQIAKAVPEPPSAVLSMIAAGSVIGYGLVRKPRAARRKATLAPPPRSSADGNLDARIAARV